MGTASGVFSQKPPMKPYQLPKPCHVNPIYFKRSLYSTEKHVLLLCPLFIYNKHVLLLLRICTASVIIIAMKF